MSIVYAAIYKQMESIEISRNLNENVAGISNVDQDLHLQKKAYYILFSILCRNYRSISKLEHLLTQHLSYKNGKNNLETSQSMLKKIFRDLT